MNIQTFFGCCEFCKSFERGCRLIFDFAYLMIFLFLYLSYYLEGLIMCEYSDRIYLFIFRRENLKLASRII